MAGLSFTWTLRYQGWAFGAISDDLGRAEVKGQVIRSGRHFILSLARVILAGFDQAVAELGETAYRAQWAVPGCQDSMGPPGVGCCLSSKAGVA